MYADLMEDELEEEDKKQLSFLQVITSESQRLTRLIDNVLGFSRAQKNTLTFSPRFEVIDNIISSTIRNFTPALSAKKIKIDFNPNATKTVLVDSEILEQILNNLLSNVEKYAASGKKVTINSTQDGDFTYIQVQDYGPGISEREQDKIFDSFYRSNSELTEGVSGAGIGLNISKQLAQLHQGDLLLEESTQGACFVVHLKTPTQ